MSDDEVFSAAILERPDDDLRRLIYADWLDERGLHDRAEFIRCQCWTASQKPEDGLPELHCRWEPPCEWHQKKRREEELLTAEGGKRDILLFRRKQFALFPSSVVSAATS